MRSSNKRQSGTPMRREAWESYAFAAPSVLLLTLFAALPIIYAVWLSLHRRMPIFGIHGYVGLDNYVRLLSDTRFWGALGTTCYFTAVSVVLELGLGLAMALFIQGPVLGAPRRGSSWARVLMLVPWAVPTVVSARIWEWLYHPEYGLLNYALMQAGLAGAPISWLGSPVLSIHAAIIMDVWKTTPFSALLLLAGLQTIPRQLYQAAVIDGAGRWSLFRHVTVPLLIPVILLVLAFRTMDAFRIFDAVFVLTGGGPGNATETLSIYAYKTLFQTLQFGYGTAVTTTMFVIVLIMTAVYAALLRRRVQVAI